MAANNGAEMGHTQKYYGAQLGDHIGPTNWSPSIVLLWEYSEWKLGPID